VDVKTIDGVSHVDGSIYAKRRVQGMFDLIEIRLEHRIRIVLLHGVHNLIITDPNQTPLECTRTSIPYSATLLDCSPGAIRIINYNESANAEESVDEILSNDRDMYGTTDEEREAFYKFEMTADDIAIRNPNIFKGEIMSRGRLFYTVVLADLDTTDPAAGQCDTRQWLFMINRLPDNFVAPLRSDRYPVGFIRYLNVLDYNGKYSVVVVQKIYADMTLRSDPTMYYCAYDKNISDHIWVEMHLTLTPTKALYDAAIFQANGTNSQDNASPSNLSSNSIIRVDTNLVNDPNDENIAPTWITSIGQPSEFPFMYQVYREELNPTRTLTIIGSHTGKYSRLNLMWITNRVWTFPRDTHHWRQYEIASSVDNSRMGIRNRKRYRREYEMYFSEMLRDQAYPPRDIIINPAGYQLDEEMLNTLRHVRSTGFLHFDLVTPGPNISFTRDHVAETNQRNDMYFRLIPNAIIRHHGSYNDRARSAIRNLHAQMQNHEDIMEYYELGRVEYRMRFSIHWIFNMTWK
jgi:hypothetical protein